MKINIDNFMAFGKISKGGYIKILKPEHPKADSQGYVLEHVLIAEKQLGKPLSSGAVVKHINGNKTDNRLENLAILKGKISYNLSEV